MVTLCKFLFFVHTNFLNIYKVDTYLKKKIHLVNNCMKLSNSDQIYIYILINQNLGWP